MKKRLVNLFLALCVMLSCVYSPVYAASSNYYSDKISASSKELDTILSLIGNQTFKSPMSTDNAKKYISHFINSVSKYNKVLNPKNGGTVSKVASDGTYNVSVTESAGCMHYAYFVSKVMYGTVGDRKYINENKGQVTASGLKAFLQTNAQAGEQLRFSGTHSLVFISAGDSGFYTLQYYGKSDNPILSYSTYEYFSKQINNIGVDFWIYNAETLTNTKAPATPPTPPLNVLSIPAGLKAERASDTTAKISWNAVSGATYYVEYKSPNTNNKWTPDEDYGKKGLGKATSYTATKLGNHEYEFRVCSVNSSGVKSDPSKVLTYTHSTKSTNSPPASAPANLKLNNVASRPDGSGSVYAVTVNVGDTVNLTWNAVSNATKYKVEPMIWNGSDWQLVGTTYTKEVSATSVSYNNLTAGAWVIKVTAGNSEGWSSKYARWNKALIEAKRTQETKTYTITFDANGGTNAPPKQTIEYNQNISSIMPTRNGYTFKGWGTEKNSIYPSWMPGEAFKFTQNLYLYAIWEVSATGKVTITYNTDGGGTIKPADHSVTKDSNGVATFYLSSIKPTRSGFTFLGWRLDNDTAYGIDNLGAKIAIQLGDPKVAETLTYYAQWEATSNSNNATNSTSPVRFSNIRTMWSPFTYPSGDDVDHFYVCFDVESDQPIGGYNAVVTNSKGTRMSQSRDFVEHSSAYKKSFKFLYVTVTKDSKGTSSFATGQTYNWTGMVECNGKWYETPVQSFVFSTDGSRYLK